MRREISETALAGNIPRISVEGRTRRFFIPFRWVEPVVAAVDFILIVGISVAAGTAYHFLFSATSGRSDAFLATGCLAFANFCGISAARESYRTRNLINFRRQLRDVTLIWGAVCLILLASAFLLKIAETFSRGSTIAFFASGWSAIIIWRAVLSRYLRDAIENGSFAERKIILITERGKQVSSKTLMSLQQCGYRPVKTFELGTAEIDAPGMAAPLRAKLEDLVETSRAEQVKEIFILIGWNHIRCIENVLSLMRVIPVPVKLLPDERVAHFLASPMVSFGATWAAELKRAPLSTYEQFIKRGFDVIVASVTLVLLCPLFLMTSLLIKLDSPGPVLFKQVRNGFNGRAFRILKFRTMSVLEDGAVIRQATRDDPRVTRVGHLLRSTNIDELPQLINVLRGEMSLVGPRPHAVAHNSEYEKLIANYAFRYHMRPGISGWAQIKGYRGETRTVNLMEYRVECDLWYINHWSIWLDLRILASTLLVGIQPAAY